MKLCSWYNRTAYECSLKMDSVHLTAVLEGSCITNTSYVMNVVAAVCLYKRFWSQNVALHSQQTYEYTNNTQKIWFLWPNLYVNVYKMLFLSEHGTWNQA